MTALRNVAPWEDPDLRDDEERYLRVYRLCTCVACAGSRKIDGERCPECRGEGRQHERLAWCASPEELGCAIVALGERGAFEDDCPMGVLNRRAEVGRKWIRPWLPSPRNVSDAGRVLGSARGRR